MDATVFESPEELQKIEVAWDRLAEAAGRPLAAPAWLLACWRHVSEADDLLRVVAVYDAGQLVGLAPYVVRLGRAGMAEYRTLGAGVGHRLAILCAEGREPEVSECIAGALRNARPRPTSIRLEAMDADSPWAQLLHVAWPGRLRPWLREDGRLSAPMVTLSGRTFDEWLAAGSKSFREGVRRGRRKLAERGATIRMADSVEQAERDLPEFMRLHFARWDQRGGSNIANPGIDAMLADAARVLVPSARMRIWSLELDGRTVASDVSLAAGGEVVGWNAGFDPAAADLRPGVMLLAAAFEDAFTRGEQRYDMGGGGQPYKLRLADTDHPIAWWTLFPRDARYPLTRLQVAPRHARERARAAAQRLDPETRRRIKTLVLRRRA